MLGVLSVTHKVRADVYQVSNLLGSYLSEVKINWTEWNEEQIRVTKGVFESLRK